MACSVATAVKYAGKIKIAYGRITCRNADKIGLGRTAFTNVISILKDPNSPGFDPDIAFLYGVDYRERDKRALFLRSYDAGSIPPGEESQNLFNTIQALRAFKVPRDVNIIKGNVTKQSRTGVLETITPVLSPSTGPVDIQLPEVDRGADQTWDKKAAAVLGRIEDGSLKSTTQEPKPEQEHVKGSVKNLPLNKPITFTAEDKPPVLYDTDAPQFKQHLRRDIFDVASDICNVMQFIKFGSRQERDDAVAVLRACRSQLSFMRQTVVDAQQEIDSGLDGK